MINEQWLTITDFLFASFTFGCVDQATTTTITYYDDNESSLFKIFKQTITIISRSLNTKSFGRPKISVRCFCLQTACLVYSVVVSISEGNRRSDVHYRKLNLEKTQTHNGKKPQLH